MRELGIGSELGRSYITAQGAGRVNSTNTANRRLVLVGSAPKPRNATVASLKPIVDSLTDPVNVELVREFQLSTIHRPVPPRFLDRVIAERLKLPEQHCM